MNTKREAGVDAITKTGANGSGAAHLPQGGFSDSNANARKREAIGGGTASRIAQKWSERRRGKLTLFLLLFSKFAKGIANRSLRIYRLILFGRLGRQFPRLLVKPGK